MKTKLSRAILLVSVSLLSVIGAAMAFSSSISSGNNLLSQDVEVLTQGESGNTYNGGTLEPAVVSCSSGDWGWCFKLYERVYWGCGCTGACCEWTGNKSHYCNPYCGPWR